MDMKLVQWEEELRVNAAAAPVDKGRYVTMTFVYLRNYSNGLDPWAGRVPGKALLLDYIADPEQRAAKITNIMGTGEQGGEFYSVAKERELLRNLQRLARVDVVRGRADETFLFDSDRALTGEPQQFPHQNTWLTRSECLAEHPNNVEILEFAPASVLTLERRLALAVQVACAAQANQTGQANAACAEAMTLVQDGGRRLGVQRFVCLRQNTIAVKTAGYFSPEWAQTQEAILIDRGEDVLAKAIARGPILGDLVKAAKQTPHFYSDLSTEHIRRAMNTKLTAGGGSFKVNIGRFLLFQQFTYQMWRLQQDLENGELDTEPAILARKREIIEVLTSLAFEDREFRDRLLPRALDAAEQAGGRPHWSNTVTREKKRHGRIAVDAKTGIRNSPNDHGDQVGVDFNDHGADANDGYSDATGSFVNSSGLILHDWLSLSRCRVSPSIDRLGLSPMTQSAVVASNWTNRKFSRKTSDNISKASEEAKLSDWSDWLTQKVTDEFTTQQLTERFTVKSLTNWFTGEIVTESFFTKFLFEGVTVWSTGGVLGAIGGGLTYSWDESTHPICVEGFTHEFLTNSITKRSCREAITDDFLGRIISKETCKDSITEKCCKNKTSGCPGRCREKYRGESDEFDAWCRRTGRENWASFQAGATCAWNFLCYNPWAEFSGGCERQSARLTAWMNGDENAWEGPDIGGK